MIYQYSDGQIGFLTVEGRSNNQRGLTIEECCDILIEHNVDFAYLMDGGGSISTCINGFMVNDAPEEVVKDQLRIFYILRSDKY
ncbi:phosphodiester glycosidase family protein [Vagococcus sp. CY52-2]|uniref:phosphodiester glycosidase family protein n=1 Tax=Vagococcus sp. CY52-2 TaxID=2925838 RepID=UPI003530554D